MSLEGSWVSLVHTRLPPGKGTVESSARPGPDRGLSEGPHLSLRSLRHLDPSSRSVARSEPSPSSPPVPLGLGQEVVGSPEPCCPVPLHPGGIRGGGGGMGSS